jgi:hypothetical protein
MGKMPVDFWINQDGSVDMFTCGHSYTVRAELNPLLRLCTLRHELKDVPQRQHISPDLFQGLTDRETGLALIRENWSTIGPVGNYKRAVKAHM